MIKSKSEAKRIAITKGQSAHEAVKAYEMQQAISEARRIVKEYQDLEDKISALGKEVFYFGRDGKAIHGGLDYEIFEINEKDDTIWVSFTSGCGGCSDWESATFPFSYLGDPDWKIQERKRLDQIKKEREDKEKKEKAERQKAQKAAEKKLYEDLKAKFEKKK